MSRKEVDIQQEIQNADMILVGVGEEFDNLKRLRTLPGYSEGRQILEQSDMAWMIPAWNRMFAEECGDNRVTKALSKLAEMVSDKNYFVVSTSTNDEIEMVSWKDNRLVMPCGGSLRKQCISACGQEITKVSEQDWKAMKELRCKIMEKGQAALAGHTVLGTCPGCGKEYILNNVYSEKYDENGYLKQWQMYMKWLQGTVNRKLLILELGVGMQCPSVIRWPFEKVAFYNQKAVFCRVNENLYQFSGELDTKGISISKNAIDWLEYL